MYTTHRIKKMYTRKVVIKMDIDVEQCRENDKIKRIISKSGLPIKHIKLLLRLSDTIYINGINYNVSIEEGVVNILLISSKPANKMGVFNTISLANVIYKLRDVDSNNEDIKTRCEVKDGIINVFVEIK